MLSIPDVPLSWSACAQHGGGLVDGKVWGAGILWPEPTLEQVATQNIHKALADAGVPLAAYNYT